MIKRRKIASDNKYLTASEAYKISSKVKEEYSEEDLLAILEIVKTCAERGETQTYPINRSKFTQGMFTKLKELGYGWNLTFASNEIIIIWGDDFPRLPTKKESI